MKKDYGVSEHDYSPFKAGYAKLFVIGKIRWALSYGQAGPYFHSIGVQVTEQTTSSWPWHSAATAEFANVDSVPSFMGLVDILLLKFSHDS